MGHTYKDSRKYYEDRQPTNRYFRKMKHNVNRKKNDNIDKCGSTGKVAFPSYEAAQYRANEIVSGDNTRDGITQFRIYKCPSCFKFHLTKDLECR